MNTKNKVRTKAKKTHREMVAEWMEDPAFKAEYDALREEYALLREMLKARKTVPTSPDSHRSTSHP